MCSRALLTYPMCVPQSPLSVEISDEDVSLNLKTFVDKPVFHQNIMLKEYLEKN
jgi:hypothetical protein